MPEIKTFSEMRRVIGANLEESRRAMESRTYDSYNFSAGSGTVFLSHSSKDKEYLPYVVKVLSDHGGKPYVDVGDNRLPNPPSVETAKVLKDTIIKCNRFVVFVTTNSKDSKWIPWELGIGDGSKKNEDIALFPSAENASETSWLAQEYLGLYHRIVWGKLEGYAKEVWMVWDYQKNVATELSKWLS